MCEKDPDTINEDETPESLLQLAELISKEMLPALYSDSFETVFAGTQKFRRLLSREPNPPIDEVIQSGAVARLVQLLASDDQPTLQVI